MSLIERKYMGENSNTDDEILQRMQRDREETREKAKRDQDSTKENISHSQPDYKAAFGQKETPWTTISDEEKITKQVDDLIDSIDKKNKERLSSSFSSTIDDYSSKDDKQHKKTHTDVEARSLLTALAVIGVLFVMVSIFKPFINEIISGEIFHSTNISLPSSTSLPAATPIKNDNAQPSVPQPLPEARRLKSVSNVTDDLSPILKRVADELEYNDINGIENWYDSPNVSDAQLGRTMRKFRATPTVNDQNNDGVINCQDYAILFYKYADKAGFYVRRVVNSKLNHAFNAVRRDDGSWEAIEPQAGEGGYILMKNAWKGKYDPSYDKVIRTNENE